MGRRSRGAASQLAAEQRIAGATAQFVHQFAVESVDRGQLVDLHVGDFLHVDEALFDEQSGDLFVDGQRLHELARVAEQFLFLLALRRGLVHDLQIPARELAREAHVLAAAANGLGELLFLHGDVHGVVFVVLEDRLHLRRRHRADGQLRRIVVPQHDVDLFAGQLAGHGLHSGAAHPHAGPHGVDAPVVGLDGDLRPRARVARRGANFDDVLGDLRDFDLEQFDEHLGRRAGEDELRAARLRADLLEQRAHAVANAEGVAGNEVFAGEDGFGVVAEVDDHAFAGGLLDGAADQLANAGFVQFDDLAALGFAHLLHDHLLCRLRRDAAELDRLHRHLVELADLQGRVFLLRLVRGEFRVRIRHQLREAPPGRFRFVFFHLALGIDHLPAAVGFVGARTAVDAHLELRVRLAPAVGVVDDLVVLLLRRHRQGGLDGLEDHLLVHAFLVGHGFDHQQHFPIHLRHA